MNSLLKDIRFGLRSLGKSPVFTAVAVLSLALGIGANTAIFTLLDQVLLRGLPVHDPERLASLSSPGSNFGRVFGGAQCFSYPMYKDLRDHNQVFTGLAAYFGVDLSFSYSDLTERANGDIVSGNYFEVLGLRPSLGRVITPDDDRTPGGHPVAMLSHGFWMRRFGGDPKILNRTVRINGNPFTVIGIGPAGFYSTRVGYATDVWVPMMMKAHATPNWNELENRRAIWAEMVGRLKPGVTLQQAEASLAPYYRALLEMELKEIPSRSKQFHDRFLNKKLNVVPGYRGRSDLREEFSRPLVVLMAMVGLVLLIACANVANLLVARAAAREREISIRLALGAGRGQIIRQLLAESLILAFAGGVGALIIASWTTGFLLQFLPSEGALRMLNSQPDYRVMTFNFAVALVTGVLFGLVPALQSTRPGVSDTLKDQANSVSAGGAHVRFRKGLVVAQVALSLLLLVGAGLFARSLYNLKSMNPGFWRENLISFSVDPSLNGYARERTGSFLEQLQQNLSAVPGARSVSMAAIPLLTNNSASITIRVENYQAKEGEDMNPKFNFVGTGYFQTMGIPLLAGRDFQKGDRRGAQKVAIVNEKFARYFFGDQNPVGRKIGTMREPAPDMEIIGVVKDGKQNSLREESSRFVYVPYAQEADLDQMTFYVRTAAEPVSVASAMRAEVRRLDANLPVFNLKTMEQQTDESLFLDRVVATLSMFFGLLATVLAAVGLYGVMAYTVARRTREIGIRMALGAGQDTVVWMVLREVALLAGLGIGIALPLAAALGRLIESQLFGLKGTDAPVMAGATVCLAAVALLAGSIPALRATRVDPMVALRYE